MKTFKINSAHDVFIDHFEHGEDINSINFYELSEVIKAEDWKTAVNNYIKNTLGYSLDVTNFEINENFAEASHLVDGDNWEVDATKLERWKRGEIKLYSNYISISVHDLIRINLS